MDNNKAKTVVPSMFVPDAELELLKATFKGNTDLLRLIKNLFFGLEVSEVEKKIIKDSFKSETLRKVINKRFFPVIDKETPIGQSIDLWTGIDLVGKSRDEIFQTISIRKKMIEMMTKALKLLENPNGERVDVKYNADSVLGDELGINLTTRNRFIGHVEFQTTMIQAIVSQKEETPQQAKLRQTQNSNK